MKGLKDFRRSLNKDRHSGGKPGSGVPATFTSVKSAVQIQPPKKVIRATRDYRSRAPQELSFQKGDFFHVLSDNTNPDWFEAVNPMTNARGLVPAACFDVLTKSSRPGAAPALGNMGPTSPVNANQPLAGPSNPATQQYGRAAGAAVTAKGGGGLYAVVKYDFVAERTDELEAKAGESIIVIAQSNFEWFVAKPIGRLGGPGLIPVAFVEIKDLTTGKVIDDVQELIHSGVVPKVEDWKKMTADYKKNTIPLGRFDFNSAQAVSNSPYAPRDAQPSASSASPADVGLAFPNPGGNLIGALHSGLPADKEPMVAGQFDPAAGSTVAGGEKSDTGYQNGLPLEEGIDPLDSVELPPGMPPGEPLPTGIIGSATVDSFHYEQGDYWFRIQAQHTAGPSPSAPPNAPTAPLGEERDLVLYRLYEDFYEFQIALLDHFPAEAGREKLADGTATTRILPLMPGPMEEVDDLITSQRRADLDRYINELCALPEYILRSELVRLFFEPRPGDHCRVVELPQHISSGEQPQASPLSGLSASRSSDAPGDVVVLSNGTNKYAEDQPVAAASSSPPSANIAGQSSSVGDLAQGTANLRLEPSRNSSALNHRTIDRSSQVSGSDGRNSGAILPGGSVGSSYLQPQFSITRNQSATTVNSRGSVGSSVGRPYQHGVGDMSVHSSGSVNAQGLGGAPQGHVTNQPPFIKIKIFHRATDDLVAIRVPPSVSYHALLDKVRDRLGPEIRILRYQDQEAGGSAMMRISDDDDLRDWLTSATKFTLYADNK